MKYVFAITTVFIILHKKKVIVKKNVPLNMSIICIIIKIL